MICQGLCSVFLKCIWVLCHKTINNKSNIKLTEIRKMLTCVHQAAGTFQCPKQHFVLA